MDTKWYLWNQNLLCSSKINHYNLPQELSGCSESERRALYVSLDGALSALGGVAARWPRLHPHRARLERLAFALAAPPGPARPASPAGTSTGPPPALAPPPLQSTA